MSTSILASKGPSMGRIWNPATKQLETDHGQLDKNQPALQGRTWEEMQAESKKKVDNTTIKAPLKEGEKAIEQPHDSKGKQEVNKVINVPPSDLPKAPPINKAPVVQSPVPSSPSK